MATIVIAEDSRTQAARLEGILDEAGFRVVVAASGAEALAALEQERADLLISDIVMPGMSGYELCRRVKASERCRALPVMLLSTLSEAMDIIRGLECGADNFLTKPYRPEQLVTRVRTILENQQLRRSSALLGIEIMFLGRPFTITSEKEQILDLLISTFEDTVQANRELQRHRAELAAAKLKLEEYARALESRVRLSEEKYGLLLEHSSNAIFLTDTKACILEANREASRLLGLPLDEVVGRGLAEFLELRNAGDFERHWARLVSEGSARLSDARVANAEGKTSLITMTAARIKLGDVDTVEVTWHDITERTRLEEQLRHAQRMEAMGQLTGGLAHDFNNLLGVIIGNLDAIRARKLPTIDEFAENALEAAERGAKLIRQLLAFARKQPLQPELISVAERLPMTVRLLQSTLGSNVTVSARIDPVTLPIVVDVSQLEAAILNLAVNARDAMTSRGTIVIECGNVVLDDTYAIDSPNLPPGTYVLISVSDNGSGMSADVAAKVFDPFFSTKGPAGTGLGLSQVFGFCRQSGGNVKIYSEVGVGTTVRLYLPAPAESEEPPAASPTRARELSAYQGTETVLLVEDNDGMREITQAQLASLGYRTIAASNGTEALVVVRSGAPVDLLLTDVVMPGDINGRDLAIRAREIRPGLKVLFTSGFTEAAIATSIRRDFGGAILSKPYRLNDLARSLRAALAEAAV